MRLPLGLGEREGEGGRGRVREGEGGRKEDEGWSEGWSEGQEVKISVNNCLPGKLPEEANNF